VLETAALPTELRPCASADCTGVFPAPPRGQAARMSELMEEPEGFENESESEEIMSPDDEEEGEESE
ncbi:MAG TPA: hypothetical protein VKB70_03130, partial [Gaiellaceae bacterium]|nr:hypothetical protein [Gaiellaceae bacterium]